MGLGFLNFTLCIFTFYTCTTSRQTLPPLNHYSIKQTINLMAAVGLMCRLMDRCSTPEGEPRTHEVVKLCLTIPSDAYENITFYLEQANYNHMVHSMKVSHTEASSSSVIVHSVVVGKVSHALLTSWHPDVSCVLFFQL